MFRSGSYIYCWRLQQSWALVKTVATTSPYIFACCIAAKYVAETTFWLRGSNISRNLTCHRSLNIQYKLSLITMTRAQLWWWLIVEDVIYVANWLVLFFATFSFLEDWHLVRIVADIQFSVECSWQVLRRQLPTRIAAIWTMKIIKEKWKHCLERGGGHVYF